MKFAMASVLFAVMLVVLLDVAMANPRAVADKEEFDVDLAKMPPFWAKLQAERGSRMKRGAGCGQLFGGDCINTNYQYCSGTILYGYCGGGNNIVCCA